MENVKEFEDFVIDTVEPQQPTTEEIKEESTGESSAEVQTEEAGAVEATVPQPQEQPVTNESLEKLLKQIENLSQQNELLHNKFDTKIAEDKHKAQLFDKMYDELASYKKDLYAKLLGPFINETISLMGDYERLVDRIDSMDREKLVKYVKGIPDDLENVLDNNGVERYSDDTEKFNPRTQRVIKTILTGDIGLDNIIAERSRKGYRWNGVMLKPEMVKIYKFKEGYAEMPGTEE